MILLLTKIFVGFFCEKKLKVKCQQYLELNQADNVQVEKRIWLGIDFACNYLPNRIVCFSVGCPTVWLSGGRTGQNSPGRVARLSGGVPLGGHSPARPLQPVLGSSKYSRSLDLLSFLLSSFVNQLL
jgi:hypothetical protein